MNTRTVTKTKSMEGKTKTMNLKIMNLTFREGIEKTCDEIPSALAEKVKYTLGAYDEEFFDNYLDDLFYDADFDTNELVDFITGYGSDIDELYKDYQHEKAIYDAINEREQFIRDGGNQQE